MVGLVVNYNEKHSRVKDLADYHCAGDDADDAVEGPRTLRIIQWRHFIVY